MVALEAAIKHNEIQWRGNVFGQSDRTYKIKISFCPKIAGSICINQKCSMGVGPCTFSSHWI